MEPTNSPHDQHSLPGPHYRASLPSVRLEIRRGRAKNLIRPISSPVYLIGAARDCDLVLGDPQFPEIHAYLFVNETGVSLRQIGEGPELTLDGTAVKNAPLEDGQRIRTGPFEFYIGIDWPEGGPRRRVYQEAPMMSALGELQDAPETIARIERMLMQAHETLHECRPPLRLYTGPSEHEETKHEPTQLRQPSRRERA